MYSFISVADVLLKAACVKIYIYTYICAYMHIYVYIYVHTHAHILQLLQNFIYLVLVAVPDLIYFIYLYF